MAGSSHFVGHRRGAPLDVEATGSSSTTTAGGSCDTSPSLVDVCVDVVVERFVVRSCVAGEACRFPTAAAVRVGAAVDGDPVIAVLLLVLCVAALRLSNSLGSVKYASSH